LAWLRSLVQFFNAAVRSKMGDGSAVKQRFATSAWMKMNTHPNDAWM